MSNSVRPHRQQPTRLPRPWDSPGKHTGVGCHFLLQCMKVKSESEVAQSCLTLSEPMDCSLPVSSIHGIFQARVLEWGAIAFSTISLLRAQVSSMIGQLRSHKLRCAAKKIKSAVSHIGICIYVKKIQTSGILWGPVPSPLPYPVLKSSN